MINELNNGILNNLPDYGVLIHQVNCLGISGTGISQQIARRWPGWFKDYRQYCMLFEKHAYELIGTTHNFRINSRQIICSVFGQIGVTKSARLTDYDALDQAFRKIEYQTRAVNDQGREHWTLHIPSGLGASGGGEWPAVYAIIEKHFGRSPVEFYIHKSTTY